MPPISGAAAPYIDLALVASMVVLTVAIIKPLIGKWLTPSSPEYDSALQLSAVGSAAGYIELATYFPAQFAIFGTAMAVAAGAMGINRVVRGSPTPAAGQGLSLTPPDPAPVTTPAPETPPAT